MAGLLTLIDDARLAFKYKATGVLDSGHPHVRLLYDSLVAWRGQAAVASVHFDKKGSTTTYAFAFTHKDGRVWEQEIIVESEDPLMTCVAMDTWRESEYAPMRPVRKALIQAVLWLGVTEIKVNFV